MLEVFLVAMTIAVVLVLVGHSIEHAWERDRSFGRADARPGEPTPESEPSWQRTADAEVEEEKEAA